MLDNILEFPISKIIFEGPEENLNLTENTQPAIFLTSYAIFNVAQKEFGLNFDKTQFIAGHSLGEYSALCCFGALSFEETIKILKKGVNLCKMQFQLKKAVCWLYWAVILK